LKSNKLNKMHITSFQQQVPWLAGKGVDLHPWGFMNGMGYVQHWNVD
jgi:hypothetical protein